MNHDAPMFADDDLELARRLSPAQARLVEHARVDGRWTRRGSFGGLWDPSPLFPNAIQPWPLIVSRTLVDDTARRVATIVRLTEKALLRRASVDLDALDAELGRAYRPALEHTVRMGGGSMKSLRADLVESPRGLHCIELNVSGALGGWQLGALADRLEATAPVTDFFAALGTRPTRAGPFPHALRRFGDVALDRGGIVAFRGRPDDDRAELYTFGLRAIAEGDLGTPLHTPLHFLRPQDMTVVGSEVRVASSGERVAVIVDAAYPVLDALDLLPVEAAGNVSLYCGATGSLLSDKRLLAYAHADASAGAGVAADDAAAFLDAVPRTEILDAADDAMLGRLDRQRSQLVLKAADGFGGRRVYVGADHSDADWTRIVREALQGGSWIVQDRVEMVTRPMCGVDDGISRHHVVWGWFQIDSRGVGIYPRVMPDARGSVVNVAQGGESAVAYIQEDA